MKSEKTIKEVLIDCISQIKEYELSEEGGDLINQGWIEALEFVLELPDKELMDIHNKYGT